MKRGGKNVCFLVVLVIGSLVVKGSLAYPTESSSSSGEEVETTTTIPSLSSALTKDSSAQGVSFDAVVVESRSEEAESDDDDNGESASDEAKEFDPSDCLLEKSRGPCRAVIDSWFFNGESCEMFMWSGCGGNNNRFREKRHCEKRCQSQAGGETATTLLPAALSNNESSFSSSTSNPVAARIMESSSTTTTTTAEVKTTVSPPASNNATSTTTAATVVVKSSKQKFECPKFEGCAKHCIVVQSVQSNHGCKQCQCPDTVETEESNKSKSIKTKSKRSTKSKSATVEGTSGKVPVGSVSGLPSSTSDDDDEKEDAQTEKPEDVCNLPQPPRGNCRAMLTRYRWDRTKQTCVEFHFGGNCDGSANANNFVTREKCLEFCKGQ